MTFFAFSNVNIFTKGLKVRVGKTAHALGQQTVAPRRSNHCILQCHALAEKKKIERKEKIFKRLHHLKMFWITLELIINLNSWAHIFLIFCVMKQDGARYLCCILNDGCSQEQCVCASLSCKLNQVLFSWNTIFTRKNN